NAFDSHQRHSSHVAWNHIEHVKTSRLWRLRGFGDAFRYLRLKAPQILLSNSALDKLRRVRKAVGSLLGEVLEQTHRRTDAFGRAGTPEQARRKVDKLSKTGARAKSKDRRAFGDCAARGLNACVRGERRRPAGDRIGAGPGRLLAVCQNDYASNRRGYQHLTRRAPAQHGQLYSVVGGRRLFHLSKKTRGDERRAF